MSDRSAIQTGFFESDSVKVYMPERGRVCSLTSRQSFCAEERTGRAGCFVTQKCKWFKVSSL